MTPSKSPSEKLHEDLRYVRRAVDRRAGAPFPLPIALLWAAICLAGFAIVDLRPVDAWKFWAVAGPAGFLLSVWLGRRSAKAAGEQDRAEGLRWAGHWLGLLVAVALLGLGFGAGMMTGDGFGAAILLLIALTYFTAGIHLARPLLPVAGVLAGGYLAILYLDGHVWLWLGAFTALALLAPAVLPRIGYGRRR